jgi:hypothetical protein
MVIAVIPSSQASPTNFLALTEIQVVSTRTPMLKVSRRVGVRKYMSHSENPSYRKNKATANASAEQEHRQRPDEIEMFLDRQRPEVIQNSKRVRTLPREHAVRHVYPDPCRAWVPCQPEFGQMARSRRNKCSLQ